MEKKNSWDDIPSLDGLAVDWEYKSKTPVDKRSYIRIKNEDIAELFEVREILVKIVTAKEAYTCRLLDISEGGLSLSLPVSLEQNLPVKIGFFIGTVKIISKAVVRHCQKTGEQYTTGIKFVDLDEKNAEYISGLYASKILRYSP